MTPKLELPTMAPLTEWSYEAYPRQRELSRAAAMEADKDGTTTTYEAVGDRTERVTWTNAKGEGWSWVQSWPCPLEDAPKIGDSYRVLHDEWILNADAGEYDRTIHAFEILTTEEAK